MGGAMFARIVMALFCCALLTAPLASSAAAPASPSVTDPAVRRAIDAAVNKDRAVYGGRTPVPGVFVGIYDSAGHSYVKGYGYADVSKKRPFTVADHFRIGSNTKTFTAAVILQLVREGKLSLDDPLSTFDIGVNIPNAKNITVREILDMRSGLFEAYQTPEMDALNPPFKHAPSTRQIIRWAVAQKPYFAPNKGYHYSNTGYLIAGLVIEAVTHDTVAHQIETRLIEPLHLTHTSVPSTQAMPEPYARGYRLDANKNWEQISFEELPPVQVMGPAGDMISTIDDIKRWIPLFVLGKTGEPAGFDPRSECKLFDGNVGFGIGLACPGDGWYGYTGGLPGYNTADYYDPALGLTIVAWVDSQEGPPPLAANAIFRDIARIIAPGTHPFNLTPGGKGTI